MGPALACALDRHALAVSAQQPEDTGSFCPGSPEKGGTEKPSAGADRTVEAVRKYCCILETLREKARSGPLRFEKEELK